MESENKTINCNVDINSDFLLMLDIHPEEGVQYLECKEVVDMHPVHVMALLILKQSAVASS